MNTNVQKRGRNSQKRRNVQNPSKRPVDGVQGVVGNALQKIPRSPGLIMPDRYYTNTRFWKFPSISLSVNNFGAIRFSPTSAFDVDPTVGSTAMSGYNELAAFYGSYRVLMSKCKIEVINNSGTVPIMCILVPLNVDPGPSPTSFVIQEWKEQPYSKSKCSNLVGAPNTVISSKMTTEKIYGSKTVYFDDNFASPTNTIPANNWWWAIGLFTNAVIAGPINIAVTIDVGTEFYDRKFLAA